MSRLALRRRLLSMEEGEQQQPEQNPEAEKAPASEPAPEQTPAEATPPAAEPEQSEQNPEGDASDKEVVESQQNADGAAPVDDQMPAPGETNDLEEEIAKQDEAISETAEAIDALESYRADLRMTTEGFSSLTASILQKAVGYQVDRLNKYHTPVKKPSFESMLAEYKDPYMTKTMSMEVIGEILSTIWEKIAAIISAIVDKFMSLLGGSSGSGGGGSSSLAVLSNKVEKTAKEPVKGKPVVPTVTIQTDGTPNGPATTNSEEIKQFNKLEKVFGTLVIDGSLSYAGCRKIMDAYIVQAKETEIDGKEAVSNIAELVATIKKAKSKQEIGLFVSMFIKGISDHLLADFNKKQLLKQEDYTKPFKEDHEYRLNRTLSYVRDEVVSVRLPPAGGGIYYPNPRIELLIPTKIDPNINYKLLTAGECDELAAGNSALMDQLKRLNHGIPGMKELPKAFNDMAKIAAKLPNLDFLGPIAELGVNEETKGEQAVLKRMSELSSDGKILTEFGILTSLTEMTAGIAAMQTLIYNHLNRFIKDLNDFIELSRENLIQEQEA